MPSGKAGESRAFGSPSRYIQGLENFGTYPHLRPITGRRCLLLLIPSSMKLTKS